MIQDETIKQLTQTGTVKLFKAQDYICYEGQPGAQMYVILKGSVGVYVTGAAEKQVEICRLGVEDFFGEMAILDNQPRSASCVALENVVCAEIGKEKLQQFIAVCPAIALKVLESLSLRIRKLTSDLYKTNAAVSVQEKGSFEIPAEYGGSHKVQEPAYNKAYVKLITGVCPICGEEVTVSNVKKLKLTLGDPRKDGRAVYKECDPLWHSIWNCPHCHYSNFYSRFFAVSPEQKAAIIPALEEQMSAVQQRPDLETPFDHLFVHYLQAIHLNQDGGNLLIGRLWLNLYWLFDDAKDPAMKKYCGERAAAALDAALKSDGIPDEETRMTIQLSMTDIYGAIGDKESALAVCNEILACKSHLLLRKLAHDLKQQYKL